MEKLLDLVSAEANESIRELAKTLGIDTQRYIPVRYENYPFFSIFCIDLENSTSSNEWITKFEILVFDADRIDELFGKFKLNIAVDKKYLQIDEYKITTKTYPEE
ncbi:MAG TPA: hypothetical protein VFG54_22555 [Prolixibacteraceae bacterium]|nr:hypothetical protein [Prolixibacteraceae bacterium]